MSTSYRVVLSGFDPGSMRRRDWRKLSVLRVGTSIMDCRVKAGNDYAAGPPRP